MGDVLAAADVLVHSSAGLTVLEAIIRGCPVVSYGFGVGHVRASNTALERFELAQVARNERELGPKIQRALDLRTEPDPRFARRPSTASLILADERRARSLPVWRVRTARAAIATGAAVVVAAWTLTTGASYSLVAHFAHIRPVTAVETDHREIGVLIDAPGGQVPALAGMLSSYGIHASFAVRHPSNPIEATVVVNGDQALPQLPGGGLVRWLGTRGQLHKLVGPMGRGHTFLYASSGPSLGQWLFAHGAGGRLVAGAVHIQDGDDPLGRLHPGEVVQVTIGSAAQLQSLLGKLILGLRSDHLSAVSVGRLMYDARSTA
jgi:hypothetical protein